MRNFSLIITHCCSFPLTNARAWLECRRWGHRLWLRSRLRHDCGTTSLQRRQDRREWMWGPQPSVHSRIHLQDRWGSGLAGSSMCGALVILRAPPSQGVAPSTAPPWPGASSISAWRLGGAAVPLQGAAWFARPHPARPGASTAAMRTCGTLPPRSRSLRCGQSTGTPRPGSRDPTSPGSSQAHSRPASPTSTDTETASPPEQVTPPPSTRLNPSFSASSHPTAPGIAPGRSLPNCLGSDWIPSSSDPSPPGTDSPIRHISWRQPPARSSSLVDFNLYRPNCMFPDLLFSSLLKTLRM